VLTLRNYDDADELISASQNVSDVVIIGSSFIGTEAAFSLKERGLNVTVIGRTAVPFENVFGTEIGRMFLNLHEKNGEKFLMNQAVISLEGKEQVETVVLESGERIKTDVVLVAIGVSPVTDFLQGVDLQPDGSVKVDRFFRINKDAFAAGDIATFPEWHTGHGIRIEHWRTAEQQGRIAAFNMAGIEKSYDSIPFFWSTQVGLHFRYVGFASEWDEIIVNGDIQNQDFIAFYIKSNQVHAAAGNGRDKEMDAIEELMRLRNMPPPAKLRDHSVDLLSLL
jgi:NADPH-dependent 2,4-dienoyl-CoA reductase/sulfur reductase-like enzyme